MPMYNEIEYSYNYFDTSGSLWQFKSDEIVDNANVDVANFSSFQYKSTLVGNAKNVGDLKGVKIAVTLKYLSNFWRSLEMLLINCRVELSLKLIENHMLATSVDAANKAIANADKATFETKDAKLYVPVVT